MLLALALSVSLVPHRELPSTFVNDRAFIMPRVENTDKRLVLWVDSDGNGFILKHAVDSFHLQQTPQQQTYLPVLDETAFPAPGASHGALPIVDDADVKGDPLYAGIDGQLGWTWLGDRIWTIDYTGHHFYQDYSAPPIPSAARVPLQFDAQHRYPQMNVVIAGTSYRAALDTAASVALKQEVRATSFLPRKTLQAWHAAHPDWKYVANGGVQRGVDLIQVPEVTVNRVTFRNVWFSTRPDDDVFKNDPVQLKLGPSAFGNCAVTLDYVHDTAGFECTPVLSYDVLISAGHEGRPESCARFPKRHCNLGTAGERTWNPIVADEATRKLREMGYSVAREPADFDGEYDVKAAIFIHFDGTDRPCTSGASIGYHTDASQPAAKLWHEMYGKAFPFRFMPDNFADNLRDYYGFRQVRTQDAGLVLELGELTCPEQREWLEPRLQWAGDFIARFLNTLLHSRS